ncbi:hypothetical protein AACH06_01460 [Ideonella sp. DXS29W]|uniref:Uncharacterized protein n=1 Tax=Ideonella lacteola TaxID=2984193 RepID=A0ABU9BK85_9BURK
MHAQSPAIAALLEQLRQHALDDLRRDVQRLRAWRPDGDASGDRRDWNFVAAQVLTVGERRSLP